MKALVGAFNQEKALVGAFSVIVKTGCETDGALHSTSGEWKMQLPLLHYLVYVLLYCGQKLTSRASMDK